MTTREVSRGGIIKTPSIKTDYITTMYNLEVNLNINGTDVTVDHGGLLTNPSNDSYKGIEFLNKANIGVPVTFIPPIPCDLIVNHGGLFKNN